MANPYEIVKKSLDLIAAARGMPPNSIQVDTMTLDDVTNEAASLAKASNIMQWGLVGIAAELWFEHKGNERTLRNATGMHSFNWGSYKYISRMLSDIIDAGIPIDITVSPEIYSVIFNNGPLLTLADRKVIFAAAKANNWPITNIKKAIAALNGIKKNSPDTFDAMVKEMSAAAERRGKIDDFIRSEEVSEES